MVSVALIGADGAGKTSIGRRLRNVESLPVKYIYMGVNPAASNHALPTTRAIMRIKRALGKSTHVGGPPDPGRRRMRPRKGLLKRAFGGVKSGFRLANQFGEEWYRQGIAWHYRRRGYVVLFDRHFFSDYFAHDITGERSERPLSRRVHGYVLKRFYPRPDLVILLDAPAEVLFARKREGTVELLERRRREYLQLRDHVRHFAVVDATRPIEQVTGDIVRIIRGFQRAGSVMQP